MFVVQEEDAARLKSYSDRIEKLESSKTHMKNYVEDMKLCSRTKTNQLDQIHTKLESLQAQLGEKQAQCDSLGRYYYAPHLSKKARGTVGNLQLLVS